ncbi:MAG: hypothetical protein AB7S38_22065 [Vulcanimicrobiota bacterium]
MIKAVSESWREFRGWVGNQVVGDDYGSDEERRGRDYAVLGATAGALAGATIGTITGFASQSQDSIREEWVRRAISHPELNGYHYSVIPDYRTECHTEGYGDDAREVCHTEIEGWWHNYSANVTQREVGSYTEPVFHHTNGWEPLMGGFLGAVGGGLLGLGIGLGVNALQRVVTDGQTQHPKLSPAKREKMVEFSGNAAIAGTVLGAGVGAYFGAKAGAIELGHQEVHPREWMIPVTQNTHIGDIPRDWYQWNWGLGWGFPSRGDDWSHGRDPVYRQVPVYDANGNPAMQQTEKVFTTNRYGPVVGGIVGGLVGAGVGLAAGVAVGTAAKLIEARSALPDTNDKTLRGDGHG